METKPGNGMKITGLILVILWILLQAGMKLFIVDSPPEESSSILMNTIMVSASMLFFGMIAWLFPRVGGVILLGWGILLSILFFASKEMPVCPETLLILMLDAGPLLVAGLLFFMHHYLKGQAANISD